MGTDHTVPRSVPVAARVALLALGLSAVMGASVMGAGPAAGPAAGTPAATRDVSLEPILSGYHRPVAVVGTGAHNRRLFIVEQGGTIRIAARIHGSWRKQGTFLDIRSKVNDPDKPGNEERGLLGLAFAPDYATSGRFYVDYTMRESGSHNGDSVLVEYQRKDIDHADPASARVVRRFDPPYKTHNGGNLAFGPDGYLYFGIGDGGGSGDIPDNAQNLHSLLGKILRIDPRDPDGDGPARYSIPADNPFIGPTYGLGEIWAYGFRNPWRWSFDRATGDLWIGDVGQCRYEEIDLARSTGGVDAGKGEDYGWHDVEGRHLFDQRPAHICDPQPLCQSSCGQLPVTEISHADGDCAVIGGYVYRGDKSPAWRGSYVFGDLCSGKLRVLDGNGALVMVRKTGRSITSFGEDWAGRLFATALDGTVSRVVFDGQP